jgi:hypothetical protein
MADERLPLLRGRVSKIDNYQAPQPGGGSPPRIPSPNPKPHSARLAAQLDAIERQIAARPETARDELASREIVAVRPAAGSELTADQLDDARADARLIGVVRETGTVLLDVADAHLEYLREKIDAFADDARMKTKVEKDGSSTLHRDKERAVAPVDTIELARLDDQRGPQLRTEALADDRSYWFEIACRGGYGDRLSRPRQAARRSGASSNVSAPRRGSTTSSAPNRSTFSCG